MNHFCTESLWYRYFLMSITQHIIIFRGPRWLPCTCTSLSSEYGYTVTHTQLRTPQPAAALQHIYTYLYKLPIAEVHSITVCSLHGRRNWDTDCLLLHGRRASSLSVILSITDFGHQIPREEGIDISALRYIIYHGFWPSDSAGRR